jgi:hypothetical protein
VGPRTVLLLRARCELRRCADEGVVQKVRGARIFCGCPSCTVGHPGTGGVREDIVRFTNAGSAPPRHAAAHQFAMDVREQFLILTSQACNNALQESNSTVPRQSPRDSMWVDFMMATGLSDEELELAKHIYAYSLRTCTFCGSNSAPL